MAAQWNALLSASAIGTVLQLIMADGGHYLAAIRPFFGIGGLGFSLLAGVIFALLCHPARQMALAGGAIAGGVCALLGIGWSVLLGDVAPILLVVGTLMSVVMGGAGGALGRALSGLFR